MGEASHQFSPQELDRIEDALEHLEQTEPEDLVEAMSDAPHAVQKRLLEYRALLVATRDALEVEHVPDGLLDGVLAEARAAAEPDVVTLDPPAKASRRSWWSRVRKGLLVPVLAVAGSTALILLIVQPTSDDLPSTTMQADGAIAKEREVVEDKRDESPAAAVDDEAPSQTVAPGEDPAAAAPVTEVATSRAPSSDAAKLPAKQEGATQAEKPAGGLIGGAVEQQQTDEADAEKGAEAGPPRWDLIARGDRARRDGDCATARKEYEQALDDADDRVRARAYVGLGLCEDRVGRSGAAEEFYGRARDLDPEVDEFLGLERPDAPTESRSKKRRTKAKPKAAPKNADSVLDNAFE